MRGAGFVYFVRCGDAVKIGFSRHPRLRFSRLQLPDLAVLGVHPGTFADENCSHKIFAGQRIRGEWFKQSEKLLLAAARGLTETLRAETRSPMDIAVAEFLAEVESFLARSGMSPTALGKSALGDPSFVPDLRAGRSPSISLVRRVREFIQQHEAPPLVPDDPASKTERTSQ